LITFYMVKESGGLGRKGAPGLKRQVVAKPLARF
jgi:hypothetical protein